MNVSVRISGVPAAGTMIRTASERVSAPAVRRRATVATYESVRKNFEMLNAERNRHGSNFYVDEGAGNTHAYPEEGRVIVASYIIAHKLRGGIVRPRNAKNLAIPVSAEAYRSSPRDNKIADLKLITTSRGGKLLATLTPDGAVDKVHYVLKPNVIQKPQPEVMPSASAFARAVQAACNAIARRV